MTRRCCLPCGLRFSRATAAELTNCPFCARPLELVSSEAALGLKLVAMDALDADEAAVAAVALTIALPVPSPR